MVKSPKKRPDLTCELLDEELVIFDPLLNVTHRLNPTASFVFDSCDGTATPRTIIREYEEFFNVDSDTAEKDVNQVLSLLQRLRLIDQLS
ncbi:MAG: PqqD family protein [Acidobacteriota bacterium]